MISHFDDRWDSAAGDGASTPAGLAADRAGDEVGLLMEAWSCERHESIESKLLLDRAQRLLARILASGELTPRNRARVRRLVAEIEAVEHGG
jgi:hypothetical protein